MATAYAKADEEPDINDEPISMEGLGDQETSDVLEAARRVRFEIKTATIRTRYDDDSKSGYVKRLVLQAAIGTDGTDGEGTNANRRLFPEYMAAFTSGDGVRDSDWWKKRARAPLKELYAALGFDLSTPINQDFLDGLVGREFVADIIKREIEKKTDRLNDKGKPVYEGTGDYQNDLKNHRAAA